MSTGLVFDTNDPGYREHLGQPYVRDFLAAHDIDWTLCHRFDVLPDGDGQLVAHSFTESILTDPHAPAITDAIAHWGYTTTHTLRAPLPPELMRQAAGHS